MRCFFLRFPGAAFLRLLLLDGYIANNKADFVSTEGLQVVTESDTKQAFSHLGMAIQIGDTAPLMRCDLLPRDPVPAEILTVPDANQKLFCVIRCSQSSGGLKYAMLDAYADAEVDLCSEDDKYVDLIETETKAIDFRLTRLSDDGWVAWYYAVTAWMGDPGVNMELRMFIVAVDCEGSACEAELKSNDGAEDDDGPGPGESYVGGWLLYTTSGNFVSDRAAEGSESQDQDILCCTDAQLQDRNFQVVLTENTGELHGIVKLLVLWLEDGTDRRGVMVPITTDLEDCPLFEAQCVGGEIGQAVRFGLDSLGASFGQMVAVGLPPHGAILLAASYSGNGETFSVWALPPGDIPGDCCDDNGTIFDAWDMDGNQVLTSGDTDWLTSTYGSGGDSPPGQGEVGVYSLDATPLRDSKTMVFAYHSFFSRGSSGRTFFPACAATIVDAATYQVNLSTCTHGSNTHTPFPSLDDYQHEKIGGVVAIDHEDVIVVAQNAVDSTNNGETRPVTLQVVKYDPETDSMGLVTAVKKTILLNAGAHGAGPAGGYISECTYTNMALLCLGQDNVDYIWASHAILPMCMPGSYRSILDTTGASLGEVSLTYKIYQRGTESITGLCGAADPGFHMPGSGTFELFCETTRQDEARYEVRLSQVAGCKENVCYLRGDTAGHEWEQEDPHMCGSEEQAVSTCVTKCQVGWAPLGGSRATADEIDHVCAAGDETDGVGFWNLTGCYPVLPLVVDIPQPLWDSVEPTTAKCTACSRQGMDYCMKSTECVAFTFPPDCATPEELVSTLYYNVYRQNGFHVKKECPEEVHGLSSTDLAPNSSDAKMLIAYVTSGPQEDPRRAESNLNVILGVYFGTDDTGEMPVAHASFPVYSSCKYYPAADRWEKSECSDGSREKCGTRLKAVVYNGATSVDDGDHHVTVATVATALSDVVQEPYMPEATPSPTRAPTFAPTGSPTIDPALCVEAPQDITHADYSRCGHDGDCPGSCVCDDDGEQCATGEDGVYLGKCAPHAAWTLLYDGTMCLNYGSWAAPCWSRYWAELQSTVVPISCTDQFRHVEDAGIRWVKCPATACVGYVETGVGDLQRYFTDDSQVCAAAATTPFLDGAGEGVLYLLFTRRAGGLWTTFGWQPDEDNPEQTAADVVAFCAPYNSDPTSCPTNPSDVYTTKWEPRLLCCACGGGLRQVADGTVPGVGLLGPGEEEVPAPTPSLEEGVCVAAWQDEEAVEPYARCERTTDCTGVCTCVDDFCCTTMSCAGHCLSFAFKGSEGTATNIDCDRRMDHPGHTSFTELGIRHVRCPGGCAGGYFDYKFGTTDFVSGSQVCAAAIEVGAIGANGGVAMLGYDYSPLGEVFFNFISGTAEVSSNTPWDVQLSEWCAANGCEDAPGMSASLFCCQCGGGLETVNEDEDAEDRRLAKGRPKDSQPHRPSGRDRSNASKASVAGTFSQMEAAGGRRGQRRQAPPLKSQAAPTPPLKSQAAPAPPLKSEAAPISPLKSQAAPTSPLKSQAAPTSPLKSRAASTLPLKSRAARTWPLESRAVRKWPLKSRASPTSPPKSRATGKKSATQRAGTRKLEEEDCDSDEVHAWVTLYDETYNNFLHASLFIDEGTVVNFMSTNTWFDTSSVCLQKNKYYVPHICWQHGVSDDQYSQVKELAAAMGFEIKMDDGEHLGSASFFEYYEEGEKNLVYSCADFPRNLPQGFMICADGTTKRSPTACSDFVASQFFFAAAPYTSSENENRVALVYTNFTNSSDNDRDGEGHVNLATFNMDGETTSLRLTFNPPYMEVEEHGSVPYYIDVKSLDGSVMVLAMLFRGEAVARLYDDATQELGTSQASSANATNIKIGALTNGRFLLFMDPETEGPQVSIVAARLSRVPDTLEAVLHGVSVVREESELPFVRISSAPRLRVFTSTGASVLISYSIMKSQLQYDEERRYFHEHNMVYVSVTWESESELAITGEAWGVVAEHVDLNSDKAIVEDSKEIRSYFGAGRLHMASLHTCFFRATCPMLRPSDVSFAPDRDSRQGLYKGAVFWTPPATFWTPLGYQVWTAPIGITTSTAYTGLCSELEGGFMLGITDTGITSLSYDLPEGTNISTEFVVCAYVGTAGIGSGAVARIHDVRMTECTLGLACEIDVEVGKQQGAAGFYFRAASLAALQESTVAGTACSDSYQNMFNAAAQCNNCQDITSGWTDSEGNTCEDYALLEYCTPDGGLGQGWPDRSVGFASYADHQGNSAVDVCCVCGAGTIMNDEVLCTYKSQLTQDAGYWGFCYRDAGTEGINVLAMLVTAYGPHYPQSGWEGGATSVPRGLPMQISVSGLWKESMQTSRILVTSSICSVEEKLEIFNWPTGLFSNSVLSTIFGVSDSAETGQNTGEDDKEYTWNFDPQGKPMIADQDVLHGTGSAVRSVTPGSFYLCWCAESHGHPCHSPSAFTVVLGSVTLLGPFEPDSVTNCFRGHDCDVQGYGFGLGIDDELFLCDTSYKREGEFYYSYKGYWPANLSEHESFAYSLNFDSREGSLMSSLTGRVRESSLGPVDIDLCWRPNPMASYSLVPPKEEYLEEGEQWMATIGEFYLMGPSSSGTIGYVFSNWVYCFSGMPCSIFTYLDKGTSSHQWVAEDTKVMIKRGPCQHVDYSYDTSSQFSDASAGGPLFCQPSGQDLTVEHSPCFSASVADELPYGGVMLAMGALDETGGGYVEYGWNESLGDKGDLVPNHRPHEPARRLSGHDDEDEDEDGEDAPPPSATTKRYHTIYRICWCIDRSETGSHGCDNPEDYTVDTGYIAIGGPFQPLFRRFCTPGQNCVTMIGGVLMRRFATRVRVMTSCDGAGEGIVGFALPDGEFYYYGPNNRALSMKGYEQSASDEFGYYYLSYTWDGPISASAGEYALCWCARVDMPARADWGHNCDTFKVTELFISTKPRVQQYSCTSGHPCSIDVPGSFLGNVIKIGTNPCEDGIEDFPPDGIKQYASTDRDEWESHQPGDIIEFTTFSFGTDAIEVPGSTGFYLCWCGLDIYEDPDSNGCMSADAFIINAGKIDFHGPYNEKSDTPTASVGCTLGFPCEFQNFTGYSLQDGDEMLVVALGLCGSSGGISTWPNPQGDDLLVSRSLPASGGGTIYSWGSDRVRGPLPGTYDLCWCRQAGERSCDTEDAFEIVATALQVVGPELGQTIECVKDHECLHLVSGLTSTPGNYTPFSGDLIVIVDYTMECASATTRDSWMGWNMTFTDGESWSVEFAAPENPFLGQVSIMRGCWCRSDLTDITSLEEVYDSCMEALVEFATVLVQGPFPEDDVVRMGDPYELSLTGIGISTMDVVLFREACHHPSPDDPQFNLTSDDGTNYHAGNLTQDRIMAKTYQKCWCYWGVCCAEFGELSVKCPPGSTDIGGSRSPTGTCAVCDIGTYKSNAGAEDCTPCGTGPQFITEFEGSLSIDHCICAAGYYWDYNAATCKECSQKWSTGQYFYCPGTYLAGEGEVSESMPQPMGGTITLLRAEPISCSGNTVIRAEAGNTPSDPDDCFCVEGFYLSGSGCAECPLGKFKEFAGNFDCVSCQDIVQDSNTSIVAAVDPLSCHCPIGTYRSPANCPTCADQRCLDCPVQFYCPGLQGQDGKISCPPYRQAANPGAVAENECLCIEGFQLSAAMDGSCETCPAGRYKAEVGNSETCMGVCPEFATSEPGAVSIENCRCKANYNGTVTNGVLVCEPMEIPNSASGSETKAFDAVWGALSVDGVQPDSVCTKNERVEVAKDMASALAETMGLNTFDVTTCQPDASWTDADNDGVQLTLTCGILELDLEFPDAMESGVSMNPNCMTRRLELAFESELVGSPSEPHLRRCRQRRPAWLAANYFDAGSSDGGHCGAKSGGALATSRRLQGATAAPTTMPTVEPTPAPTWSAIAFNFVVIESSPEEAEALSSGFDSSEFASYLVLQDTTQYASVAVTTEQEAHATTSNATCPDSKAFPPEASFISIEESCKCAAGWAVSTVGCCAPCRLGEWKSWAGNDYCLPCRQNRITLGPNSTSDNDCVCDAGFMENADQDCVPCVAPYFCPLDSSNGVEECANDSRTDSDGAGSADFCRCNPGYTPLITGECVACPSGKYKSVVANSDCTDCPSTIMITEPGAVDVSECKCPSGYYYKGSRDSPSGGCASCANIQGVQCDGGFIGNMSEKMDKMPFAIPGYFLIARDYAEECREVMEGDEMESFCYGCIGDLCGDKRAITPCLDNCNCRPGHFGFMCENCDITHSRAREVEKCQECDRYPIFMGLFTLWSNAFCASLIAHALTYMAIQSAQGSASLHSALLRLWQAWVLSMTPLKIYNFGEAPLFAWTQQNMALDMLGSDPNMTVEDSQQQSANLQLSMSMPDWFADLSPMVYALGSFIPVFSSPTVSAECLGQALFPGSPERGKHWMAVLWWCIYPGLVLLTILFQDFWLVYLLYPIAERKGMIPPQDEKEKREYFLYHQRESVKAVERKLRCQEADMAYFKEALKAYILDSEECSKSDINEILQAGAKGLDFFTERLEDARSKTNLGPEVVISLRRSAVMDGLVNISSERLARWDRRAAAGSPEWESLLKFCGENGKTWSDAAWDTVTRSVRQGSCSSVVHWIKDEKDERGHAARDLVDANIDVNVVCWRPLLLRAFQRRMSMELAHRVVLILEEGLRALDNGKLEGLMAGGNGESPDLPFLEIARAAGHHGTPLLLALTHDTLLRFLQGTLGEHFGEAMEALIDAVEVSSVVPAVLEPLLEQEPVQALLSIAALAPRKHGSILKLQLAKPMIMAWLDRYTNVESIAVCWLKIRKCVEEERIVHIDYFVAGPSYQELYEYATTSVKDVDMPGEAVLQFGNPEEKNVKFSDYKVLGMYRVKPSFKNFLVDARPIMFIAIYSLWHEVTTELLLFIQCAPYTEMDPSDDERVTLSVRWKKQRNWECGTGDHTFIYMMVVLGIGVWSIGFVIMLGLAIRANKHRLSEPRVQRVYAYFIQGYEIQYCWWDIIVKRVDLALVTLVTYAFVPDLKAKLLCYTVLSLFWLILHQSVMPFDNRKNGMVDRCESFGLIVRAVTFTVIAFLMIFAPRLVLSSLLLAIVVLLNLAFICMMWSMITFEFVGHITQEGTKTTMVRVDSVRKRGRGAFHALQVQSLSVAASVTGIALQLAVKLAKLNKTVARGAICAVPMPDGSLKLIGRAPFEYEGRNKAIVLNAIRLYEKCLQEDDDAQRGFWTAVLGSYYDFWMGRLDAGNMPGCFVERIVMLSMAYKKLRADGRIQLQQPIEKKAELILSCLSSEMEETILGTWDAVYALMEDGSVMSALRKHEAMQDDRIHQILRATVIPEDREEQFNEARAKLQEICVIAEDLNDFSMLFFRCVPEQVRDMVGMAGDLLDKFHKRSTKHEEALRAGEHELKIFNAFADSEFLEAERQTDERAGSSPADLEFISAEATAVTSTSARQEPTRRQIVSSDPEKETDKSNSTEDESMAASAPMHEGSQALNQQTFRKTLHAQQEQIDNERKQHQAEIERLRHEALEEHRRLRAQVIALHEELAHAHSKLAQHHPEEDQRMLAQEEELVARLRMDAVKAARQNMAAGPSGGDVTDQGASASAQINL